MKPPTDPNLLVGMETGDDAAVYRISDEAAMINTADFITPPVDDPYWFGQIAAANAISDVYSMGGRPLTALNLVMFPVGKLDIGLLRDILRGGHDKVLEAGASLVGGHSIEDDEPKYGLAVSGVVHPGRIITNAGAKPGDALILTKPLGSGVLFNAALTGKYPYADLEREVLPSLAALNGPAMSAALEFDLNACTDITGFGLAGHLWEMAAGGGVAIEVQYSALPLYPGTVEMYQKGQSTGSNAPNRVLVKDTLQIQAGLSAPQQEILYDPQTSGGLMLCLPQDQADDLLSALEKAGVVRARQVGRVIEGAPGIVVV